MQTASGLPIRKQIRLRDFHYGGGCACYVTICAFEKRMLFGTCADGVVSLNEVGRVVEQSWSTTADLRHEIVLDEFIVMPNHMHAILHLSRGMEREGLFRIIGGFKSSVTSSVRTMLADDCYEVWQKRFHDHVIRSGAELDHLRRYIRANPLRWCGMESTPDDSPSYELPV